MTNLKLKVERCFDCPFSDSVQVRHNYVPLCQFDFDDEPKKIDPAVVNVGTPDWCPIRGKVVTIEGPEVKS